MQPDRRYMQAARSVAKLFTGDPVPARHVADRLGIATVFTLVLIPVIYSLLAPLVPARAHTGVRLDRELREIEPGHDAAPVEAAE